MAEKTDLGTDLSILPSNELLQVFFRSQVRVFEKTLIRKIKDANLHRITAENPREKVIVLDVSRLVFTKCLGSKLDDMEILQRNPFVCEIKTLSRICELLGRESIVRRFSSGDFAVIFPVYALTEDYIVDEQTLLMKCQLLFGIQELDESKMKCLVPYGGSNPGDEDTLPEGYSVQSIEVNGDVLHFPSFKGKGTLNVDKGFNFVYTLPNTVLSGDCIITRNETFKVIGVVNDTFNSERDLVRLDKCPKFNAKRATFYLKRPVKIICRTVILPTSILQQNRMVSLKYYKEDVSLQQGELQLKFHNSAFNTCGIMTHDVAITMEELCS